MALLGANLLDLILVNAERGAQRCMMGFVSLANNITTAVQPVHRHSISSEAATR